MASASSVARSISVQRAMAWIAAGVAAVLAMLTPALWNGFPLLFPDTGGYLARPFEDTLEMGRSALYGAFLAAGIPFHFWANIVLQSALAVWLIGVILRVHGLATPVSLLATVAGLCLVTGLPWYATTLMPDILLPAAVLALYLLAFQANACGAVERGGLVATVAVAIASHMGTLAVTLGLVLVVALLAIVRMPGLLLPRPQRPLLVAGAVVAGIVLAPLSNLAVVGKFAFTPGGDSFLFGRLVQDGIIARYLEDRCPDPGIALCAYRNTLPDTADGWLWTPGNPLGELGGWRGYAKESRRIILDTLRMYPLQHIQEAATTTLEQLTLMKTEVSLVPDWMKPAIGAMSELVPDMMPDVMSARQQAAPFTDFLARLNLVHVSVAALSLVLLVLSLSFARRLSLEPHATALALVVGLTVVINAAVCGTFSNPVDRYQSRLLWLAPFAVVIIGLTWRNRRRMTSRARIGSGLTPAPTR